MADPRDLAVNAIANRQQGQVHRLQLHACGLDDAAIRRRVRSGRLYRVYPGVYSVGRPPATAIERASAAALACGGPDVAALSHGSAMTLWGFWTRWDQPFEVTVLRGQPRPDGVVVHRTRNLRRFDTTRHNGIRVTKPARVMLDMTPRLDDERLWRTVDNALLTPYLHRARLQETILRYPHHPGAKRLMKHAISNEGVTRSQFERMYRAFADGAGLPPTTLNVIVNGHEVDAYYPEARLIVQCDGWDSHRLRTAFENDRDLDAAMLDIKHITYRLTWTRMTQKAATEGPRLLRVYESRL